MKMTFQPKKRSRAKVHGFRARMFTMLSTLFIALAQVDGHHEGKVEEIK